MRKSAVCKSVVCVLGLVVLIVAVVHIGAAGGRAAARTSAISVALPGCVVTPERLADGTCRFAGNDATQRSGRAGDPDVPAQAVTILLPPDADAATVRAAIPGHGWTAIDGQWDIPPLPPLAPDDCGDPSPAPAAPQDPAGPGVPGAYGVDALYPSDPVRQVDVQEMRGWKMATVLFSPYAYNPVTRQVYRLSGDTIEVSFQRTASNSDGVDLGAAAKIKRAVVNFSAVASLYGDYAASPARAGGYVIITTAAIEEASHALMDFVASKEARGFTVHVATEDLWGGGTGNTAANNIRSWLKSNYLTLDIEYVLLIGNPNPTSGDVPMKMCHPLGANPDYPNCPTDFFYAELSSGWNADGDSLYGEFLDDFRGIPPRVAEVAVGRIPCYGDTAALDHILNKIIAYENAPAAGTAWRRNVLLPMKPSDSETPGYPLGEEIKSKVVATSGWSCHRVYDSGYGLNPAPESMPCTVAKVSSAWKATPCGAVIWWTHGTATSASYVMNTYYADTLDDAHPSLAFQCSCLNGTPESASNLGYSLLLNGCISTVCASRVSWYEIGQTSFAGTATNAGMAFGFADRIIGAKMLAGDALNDLKSNVMPGYEELWMNYLDFNLYGDPAIGLFTRAADRPEPSVLTYYPENVTTGAARLRANLVSLGNSDAAEVSFQWGTSPGLYDQETAVQRRSVTGTFYADLSGLDPGRTYYYRARTAGSGTGYGDEKSFTTMTTPPSVSTSSVTAITSSSARLNGNLSSLGTAGTATVWFEWGDSSGGPLGETPPEARTDTGSFYHDLSGLTPDTTYYFRARADGDGAAQGAERTFTTPPAPPIVETASATSLDGTSALLNGALLSTGSASSVTVSFEWGLSPGTYGRTTTAEAREIDGPFSFRLTGLTPGATYHYRARADGAGSRAYGQDMGFTAPVTPPTVASEAATNLEMTSATLNANLLSRGTAGTVTVSFEWGEAPGIYGRSTAAVQRTSTGAFRSDLTGLTAGTTYYYRARADGHGEPSYGFETSFTTATASPAVTTGAATGVSTSSATLNGELISRGLSGSVQVSFEWGTTPGAYSQETRPEVKTAPGPFQALLTGMDSGATLYYRTKAIGYGDPVYGPEASLTLFRKPQVTAVSPATGGTGQSLTLAISGSAFTGATALSLGPDIVLSGFQVTSDSQVTARVLVPCDAVGPADVSVTTEGGTSVLAGGFAVVDSPPSPPRNLAPLDGVGTTTLAPGLTSSPFSHLCPARSHAASQWQVTGIPGDYSRPAFDSGTDSGHLTSITLPPGVAETCAWCWWRVRYQDDRGAWSEWSQETSFSPPAFLKAALSGAAGIQVCNSLGLVTGSSGGRPQAQIPQSTYDNGTVTVLSPVGSYRHRVSGTGDGAYTLTVTRLVGDRLLTFRASGIPISAGAIHEYTIDWNRVHGGGKAATIRIDSDGDGVPERTAVVAAEIDGPGFLSAGAGGRRTPAWAWALIGLAALGAGAGGAALLLLRRRQHP